MSSVVNRTCRTPGCINEDTTVRTGLRSCIFCGKDMATEKSSAPATPTPNYGIYGGYVP